jgi:taurine dioxygenase
LIDKEQQMTPRKIDVIPQTTALGAEIRGVDLSHEVDERTFQEIHNAFLTHQVIFFRDQTITPEQQLAFAARFGTPMEYPLMKGLPECPIVHSVVKEAHETENFAGEHFHSDTTYVARPPAFTVLCAKEVPPVGGDTLFASMYRAADQLSAGLRSLLEVLKAVNSSAIAGDYFAKRGITGEHRVEKTAEHPVLLRVPETGKLALYINASHTKNFSGMTREESLPLIEYLCQQAIRPENCFRLSWQKGTVTIWDNRCTQHFPVNDYHGYRRVMHRIIVSGPWP